MNRLTTFKVVMYLKPTFFKWNEIRQGDHENNDGENAIGFGSLRPQDFEHISRTFSISVSVNIWGTLMVALPQQYYLGPSKTFKTFSKYLR